MQKTNTPLVKFAFRFLAVILALLFTSLVLLVAKTNPIEAYKNILQGSLGSWRSVANTLVVWVPLMLATLGLLFTYATGLWNIGIEGQIVLGAIFTTWALRVFQTTSINPTTAVVLAILAGIVGGAMWAALVGLLRIYGGVNEIFGGLGLNFVATALTIWLIFSPWKRPGVASMSGTEPFDEAYWLTQLEGLRLSPGQWQLALSAWSGILCSQRYLFWFEAKSSWKKWESSSFTWYSNHRLSDDSFSYLRCICRSGRSNSSRWSISSSNSIDLFGLRLPGDDGGYARQLPAFMGGFGCTFLCCIEYWQHSTSNRSKS